MAAEVSSARAAPREGSSARAAPREGSADGVDDALVSVVQADADRLLAALETSAELSVLLCDDAAIADLNRQYRDKDGPTDVLSFPQDDDVVLGDVVISVETAARQAAELGHDLPTELRVLLVHGLCHLLGHDHERPEDADAMRREEARLLAALGEAAPGLVRRADG